MLISSPLREIVCTYCSTVRIDVKIFCGSVVYICLFQTYRRSSLTIDTAKALHLLSTPTILAPPFVLPALPQHLILRVRPPLSLPSLKRTERNLNAEPSLMPAIRPAAALSLAIVFHGWLLKPGIPFFIRPPFVLSAALIFVYPVLLSGMSPVIHSPNALSAVLVVFGRAFDHPVLSSGFHIFVVVPAVHVRGMAHIRDTCVFLTTTIIARLDVVGEDRADGHRVYYDSDPALLASSLVDRTLASTRDEAIPMQVDDPDSPMEDVSGIGSLAVGDHAMDVD